MKKRNLLFITMTILGLSVIGCQPQATQTAPQQETVANAQTSNSSEMVAETPKSDDDSVATTEATTATAAQTSNTDTASQNAISEEEAKKIALEDAKVDEKDVTGIRVKRDMDDGISVYEVEFYVQNKEYDYEIDSNTGEIVSKDYDIENDFSQQQTTTTGSEITREEAIDIVLKRVDGATEQDVRIKLDTDDGHRVYEGEVYYNRVEYEFELNAANGEILEWSEDKENY